MTYLDQLEKKPKARLFSKVMKQKFPEHIIELKDRLRNRFGIEKGDFEFIKILKLKRK